MPIKINGSTSGSVTLAAPATGSDVTLTLPTTALATLASPSFTGDLVWSGATLRAATASVLTYQTTNSTTFTDLATAGPSVTVTTGTKALVIVTARMSNGSTGYSSFMGFAVSGASSVSAVDERTLRIWSNALGAFQVSAAFLLTGLTAGSNTFTAKYKAENPSTANFENRIITVIDMGS